MDKLLIAIYAMCIIFPISFGLIIVISFMGGKEGLEKFFNKKAREKEEQIQTLRKAKSDYQNALERLKESPGDVNLRQEALQLGREFCALSNEGQLNLINEVMVANEIQIITSGGTNKR